VALGLVIAFLVISVFSPSRRAVDILQERFELIPEHLGYAGHSFGASFGGVIAGVEYRIKAYVFMAG
jgi:cephalosporin-C deacetylase-like acetyl esterase